MWLSINYCLCSPLLRALSTHERLCVNSGIQHLEHALGKPPNLLLLQSGSITRRHSCQRNRTTRSDQHDGWTNGIQPSNSYRSPTATLFKLGGDNPHLATKTKSDKHLKKENSSFFAAHPVTFTHDIDIHTTLYIHTRIQALINSTTHNKWLYKPTTAPSGIYALLFRASVSPVTTLVLIKI